MLLPLTLLLFSAGPDPPDKVTAKTFAHHPAIAEARAVYEDVQRRLQDGRLSVRVRAAEEECWDWSELRLGTDTSSTARYFFRLGGGQDSVHRHNFYYDARGILRFALLQGGATTNSTIEMRVWFDAQGREIYRTSKNTGPGFTWIEGDPAMLIHDPRRMFREGAGACRLGPPGR